jgi:hypothetical protein
MDTKIIDELEVAYSEELNLTAGNLGALGEAVRAKMQQLGQGLFQRLVQRQPNGYTASSISCNCGEKAYGRMKNPPTIMTCTPKQVFFRL